MGQQRQEFLACCLRPLVLQPHFFAMAWDHAWITRRLLSAMVWVLPRMASSEQPKMTTGRSPAGRFCGGFAVTRFGGFAAGAQAGNLALQLLD